MDITLGIDKSIEENASTYFDKAKKLKQKIGGLKEALTKTTGALTKVESLTPRKQSVTYSLTQYKKHWYEKFRWFYTSSDILVIGGRDATTNDILIKKHLESHDFVYHTDIAGSPFFILKGARSEREDTELAQGTAMFSRAWKARVNEVKVYVVPASQVSQKAPSGEYLTKGGFMIYGKKTYLTAVLEGGIVMREGIVMCGPWEALQVHANAVKFCPGDSKPSDAAKILKKRLLCDDLDAIIRALPSGGIRLL